MKRLGSIILSAGESSTETEARKAHIAARWLVKSRSYPTSRKN